MVNSTSLRFIFGFLTLIAASLMIVIATAYYEEVISVKQGVAAHCEQGKQC